MARSHARIALRIWADRDFLALPMHAQWLYMALISQEGINHAGIVALTPRRWAALSADREPKLVDDALDVLGDRRFVLVDADAEQLLVRSFIRNDGVAQQPNTLKSACASILLVTSRPIRAALLAELRRLDHTRIGAMRVPVGHEPVLSVLWSTIADLEGDDPPPEDHATTPSDGYDSVGINTDAPKRTRVGAGAGEGEGEAPVLRLGSGSVGEATPPPNRRRSNRDPGPGQRPLVAVAEPHAIPARCPHCTRLGLADDDPGPNCVACGRLREQREQRAANAASWAARAQVDERAARRAAIQACHRCDETGMHDTGAGLARCNHQETA